jgi:hypothetical protein
VLETDESKTVLPLPRSAAVMLLERRERSASNGRRAYVFDEEGRVDRSGSGMFSAFCIVPRSGRGPPMARRVSRTCSYEDGTLGRRQEGQIRLRRAKRKVLPPLDREDAEGSRHAAAQEHERNNDRRRELVRARLESPHGSDEEAPDRRAGWSRLGTSAAKTRRLQGIRDSGQQAATPCALMVRKGSPVRVRQRALRNPLETAGFVVRLAASSLGERS